MQQRRVAANNGLGTGMSTTIKYVRAQRAATHKKRLSGSTRSCRFELSDQYVIGQRFDFCVGQSYVSNVLASY
jgi:hypothetical protein